MSRPRYTFRNLNIPITAEFVVTHTLAINALFFFRSWAAFWICVGLSLFTAWIGVGLCYHRLLTHKSFETPKWFRYFLVIVGASSGEAGPLFWVDRHRTHHAYSDHEGDPHSPRDGFGWAHILWLTFNKTESLIRVRDLQKDPVIVLIDRFYWVTQVVISSLLLILGYLWGGIYAAVAWISWGVGMRTTYVRHLTWLVNSAAHKWGYRRFEVDDDSRNFPPGALLAGGEWHNNHHRYQSSARHGLKWWEFDPTYWVIVALSWVGLAWDIRTPEL